MATRADLTPNSAEFPNTTNFPGLSTVNGRPVLWFDGATDEECAWSFVAPVGLTGALTLVLYLVAASATTGTCRFQVQVEAVTPADALDLDASSSYDTANSNGGTVAGTAGYLFSIAVTLTNADSMAAGDYVRILVHRDADGTSGTDDVTTDIGLLHAEFRDAA
jgi:hypothetical protein